MAVKLGQRQIGTTKKIGPHELAHLSVVLDWQCYRKYYFGKYL